MVSIPLGLAEPSKIDFFPDFAAKYVRLEYFHIGLRRASSVHVEWQWTDGSEIDYANYECWQETLGADGPQCVSAPLGAGSPPCVWRPVECYPTKLPYICVAPAAQQFSSTEAGKKWPFGTSGSSGCAHISSRMYL